MTKSFQRGLNPHPTPKLGMIINNALFHVWFHMCQLKINDNPCSWGKEKESKRKSEGGSEY